MHCLDTLQAVDNKCVVVIGTGVCIKFSVLKVADSVDSSANNVRAHSAVRTRAKPG